MKGTERTIAVEIPSATSAPWTVQLIHQSTALGVGQNTILLC